MLSSTKFRHARGRFVGQHVRSHQDRELVKSREQESRDIKNVMYKTRCARNVNTGVVWSSLLEYDQHKVKCTERRSVVNGLIEKASHRRIVKIRLLSVTRGILIQTRKAGG